MTAPSHNNCFQNLNTLAERIAQDEARMRAPCRKQRNNGAQLLVASVLLVSSLSSQMAACQQQQQQQQIPINGSIIESIHRQQMQTASLSSSMLRTYIRTNNMRAYHLDLHTYRPEAKFEGDPEFVDSTSAEHQARCRRHLKHYNELLRAYQHTDPMDASNSLDSLRLADTYGRPDAGLLDGHQFWLGSYERCLELQFKTTREQELVQSQYCLALAQFPSWKPEDSKMSIKIGLCLPETCTSSMLNEQEDLFSLSEQMMKYHLGGPNQPLDKLKLRSVYCLPHETSQVRQVGWSGRALISVITLLAIASIYATLYDYLHRKADATEPNVRLVVAATTAAAIAQQQQEKKIPEVVSATPEHRNWRQICVESFSLMRNFEKIFPNERPKRPEAEQAIAANMFNKDIFFNSITGIKCIGLIWIIGAHTFLVGPIVHKNLIYLDNLTKTYLANLYLAAHLMVDSFFALSGLLASYLLFKSESLSRMQLKSWIILTIHRYWRLTPVYLLCYWFAKSLGSLTNSGPLWDYATSSNSPRLQCAQESWWEAILYMADFKSPKAHCVPFAWFIANGIKFWIITPLFVMLIHKSARRGYTLLVGAIVANIALVIRLAISSNVDMKSVIEFKPESADNMLNNMEQVYTRPYSRVGAYLVGLLAGHMIYVIERRQEPLRMSEKMKILTWSLVSLTTIVLTFVVKIAGGVELEESAIPWVFSLSAGFIRPLWALCTCWLVYALAHGQARLLGAFLSAPLWRYLVKLSFCAYLLQGEVIANLYFSYTHSNPYTYVDMLTRPIVASVLTIALSVVMALLVEYPLIGIEELLLPAKRLKAPSPPSQVQVELKSAVTPASKELHSSVDETNSTTKSANELKLKRL